MRVNKLFLALVATSALGACASSTKEIAPAYISPLEYQDYSCKQIGTELSRITRRAQQVAHDVDKNASGDSVAMGVGLVLFWPALFFIDGDTPQAQEYAELKGRFNALEEVAIQKNCTLKIQKDPFHEIENKKQPAAKAPEKE